MYYFVKLVFVYRKRGFIDVKFVDRREYWYMNFIVVYLLGWKDYREWYLGLCIFNKEIKVFNII